jgi:hypothetical protein
VSGTRIRPRLTATKIAASKAAIKKVCLLFTAYKVSRES